MNTITPALRHLAVPITAITADPANVRDHDARNLATIRASLAGFGQQKPIVIDATGRCLAGNGTLAAARSLGWTEVAAVRSELTGRAATAYAIADNRTTDLSVWRDQRLAEQLATLQNDEAIDHTLTGFDDDDIEAAIDHAMGLTQNDTRHANPDDDQNDNESLPPQRDIPILHQLLIACPTAESQHTLHDRLTDEGYEVKVLGW